MVEGAKTAVDKDGDGAVQIVSCVNCEGPVPSTAAACTACGTPLGGKEFAYIHRQEAGPDIPGLFKWWGIWSVGIWALSGFSLGIGSSLMLTLVSGIYLVRILRAYYR